MSAHESGRERLTAHVRRCQALLEELWEVTAERGKLSEQTLRRLRNPRYYDKELTPANKTGIEDALYWNVGDVDRVMQDPDFVPVSRKVNRRIDLAASVEDIAGYLDDLRAGRPADFQQALHRLDIKWSPPAGG
ncbi:hypothetical protein JOF56_000232 [Kibdelosporangium banguiense]|uniref:Uncharacterized protein n=1 Tax=Kibdelosporangium banguiense TaxID=1365924 RepID=A0ABS4T5W2_9PSEU|nr:hypothetical protein [Kibdelosporangium banguiense]MBP2319847.1 hypothetical protein [Kibdelosporangium banguiense]